MEIEYTGEHLLEMLNTLCDQNISTRQKGIDPDLKEMVNNSIQLDCLERNIDRIQPVYEWYLKVRLIDACDVVFYAEQVDDVYHKLPFDKRRILYDHVKYTGDFIGEIVLNLAQLRGTLVVTKQLFNTKVISKELRYNPEHFLESTIDMSGCPDYLGIPNYLLNETTILGNTIEHKLYTGQQRKYKIIYNETHLLFAEIKVLNSIFDATYAYFTVNVKSKIRTYYKQFGNYIMDHCDIIGIYDASTCTIDKMWSIIDEYDHVERTKYYLDHLNCKDNLYDCTLRSIREFSKLTFKMIEYLMKAGNYKYNETIDNMYKKVKSKYTTQFNI